MKEIEIEGFLVERAPSPNIKQTLTTGAGTWSGSVRVRVRIGIRIIPWS